MKNLLSLSVLLILLTSCGSDSGGDTPIDRPEEQAPSSLRWDKADLPIIITIPQDFTAAERQAAFDSGEAWEEAYCKYRGELVQKCQNLFFVFRDDATNQYEDKPDELYDSLYDDNSVIYKMIDYWFENRSDGELATTTLLYSNNTMISSDILFNFHDHDFGDAQGIGLRFDFESVLIHELGHMLGFNHTTRDTSVMQARISRGQTRRDIFTYEGDACKAIEGQEASFDDTDSQCQELKDVCESSTCNGEWNPSNFGDAYELFEKYQNLQLP